TPAPASSTRNEIPATMTRREFVRAAATGVGAGLMPGASNAAVAASGRGPPKAGAFDPFPLFSPPAVVARAETPMPGRGTARGDEWRVRQFEYAWLRVLSRRYVDFWQVTEDALTFACRKLGLDLGASQRDSLMNAFLELDPWPDVVPALTSLRKSGLR